MEVAIAHVRASTEKLVVKLRSMVQLLEEHHNDYIIHNTIAQFYYMQVAEEIALLHTKVAAGERCLEPALRTRLMEAFFQWRKDYRWLGRYLKGG